MTTKPEAEPLPVSSYPFFQEYDPTHLDINQHAELIIERILAYGNRAEVNWLLATYGRETIRGWIAQRGVWRLSRRRYHLWCFVFEVPSSERPRGAWSH